MPYSSLSREDRQELHALELGLTIDPGFVHRNRIQTIVGGLGMTIIDDMTAKLPEVSNHERERRIDHIYTKVFLEYCRIHKTPTLENVLNNEQEQLFCSNIVLKPCDNIYDVDRAMSVWNPSIDFRGHVELHYTTNRVKSDTLRTQLREGGLISVVAMRHEMKNPKVRFDPLIMGFPWVTSVDPRWENYVPWVGLAAYEVSIEDFDEFASVSEFPIPASHLPMKSVPEKRLKAALAQHLCDPLQNDWGGEKSDHFSTNLHLNGKPITGAFLLKGPSRYRPMTVADLGKNGNQIIRLSQEPANVLIVQHCHDITPDVRTMLQAIATQPGNPRYYCCIDGRQTLRILHALDLYEAVASKK